MKYIEKSYEKLFEEFEQLDHILTFTFFMFISDWTIYHKKYCWMVEYEKQKYEFGKYKWVPL